MPATLTIFTPAYNQAHLQPRLYESLCRQSCRDFFWIIIDDGSTDNTRELVKRRIAEQRLPIRYEYKPKVSMHTAHNLAYRLIDTELNTCIDFDDYILDDAVEKILHIWREKDSGDVFGIVGLDATEDGRIIGTPVAASGARLTLTDFYHYGCTEDKKLVYRYALVYTERASCCRRISTGRLQKRHVEAAWVQSPGLRRSSTRDDEEPSLLQRALQGGDSPHLIQYLPA